jgi:hypothetical protein
MEAVLVELGVARVVIGVERHGGGEHPAFAGMRARRILAQEGGITVEAQGAAPGAGGGSVEHVSPLEAGAIVLEADTLDPDRERLAPVPGGGEGQIGRGVP